MAINRKSTEMKLRNYQVRGLHYMRAHNACALFWEMRLGKTLTTIRHVQQLPYINYVLVVAPYSALIGWKQELKNSNISYTEFVGTKKQRLSLLTNNNAKYILMNKEGFLVVPEIAKCSFNVIILDESTFIKNPKAKVTKFFIKNFTNVKYKIILSGTPAPESPLDYFCQLQFLNPNILGYRNYWEFRHEQCYQAGFEWRLKRKGLNWLTQRLSRTCSFLKRQDVGFTEKKIYEQRNIALPGLIKKAYDKLEKEFWVDIQGVEIRTAFAGAKFCYLRELTGGFAHDTLVSDYKIQEIINLLQGELKKESVVIWLHSPHRWGLKA